MKSRSRKYYNKLRYNKYISNKVKLNKLNEYFRNCLENIPIKTLSHGVTRKQVLPRITCIVLLLEIRIKIN